MTISQIFCLINAIISIATTYLSFLATDFKSLDNQYRLHWSSDKPGYILHLIGAISEWLTINSMSVYFMCICIRMKHFERWNIVWQWLDVINADWKHSIDYSAKWLAKCSPSSASLSVQSPKWNKFVNVMLNATRSNYAQCDRTVQH